MALGAPDSVLPRLFNLPVMPPQFDLVMLVTMGFAVSTQSLLFGMTTQLMGAEMAGRALAATNLALFLGTALLQSATGVVAARYGLAGGNDVRRRGAGGGRTDFLVLCKAGRRTA